MLQLGGLTCQQGSFLESDSAALQQLVDPCIIHSRLVSFMFIKMLPAMMVA
jgi:hypothetical protein